MVQTQIFFNGTVLWNYLSPLPSISSPEFKTETKRLAVKSHKFAFKFLKEYSENVSRYRTCIKKLKLESSGGICTLDLMHREENIVMVGDGDLSICSFFNQSFNLIIQWLDELKQSGTLNYYMLVLDEMKGIVVGTVKGTPYLYSMTVDFNKITQGMLLNVILPKFLQSIQKIAA